MQETTNQQRGQVRGARVTHHQVYRRTTNGDWKPVRGLVYTLRSSAEKMLKRSRSVLEIRPVHR
jgi:hypothetical protein